MVKTLENELGLLKANMRDLYCSQEFKFLKFSRKRTETNQAYAEMEKAWQARLEAEEVLHTEYDALQSASNECSEVFEAYCRVRDRNRPLIEKLQGESDEWHQKMRDAFNKAREARNNGDKIEASRLSAEGREYRDQRNSLNNRINDLRREIGAAKGLSFKTTAKVDSSAYQAAKLVYLQAKLMHGAAQGKFKRLKAEMDNFREEFEDTQVEYLCARRAYQDKLLEMKAEQQRVTIE